MGELASSYFTEAVSLGGSAAKQRLALLARVTSVEAGATLDTPALSARLEKGLAQIRIEAVEEAWLKLQPARRDDTVVSTELGPETFSEIKTTAGRPVPAGETILRGHVEAFLDLMSHCAMYPGDVHATIRRVTEAAAVTLVCERVSVWFLSEAQQKIRCADLFIRRTSAHSVGDELFARDFPDYFRALASERTIAAHDANHDARTAGFSAPYLQPLGITSMLDVPIWSAGQMVGVLCCEHVGPPRTWNADEERFGFFMANVVAIAIDRAQGETTTQVPILQLLQTGP
ncbi:MAG: GAF domain-containing protein [Deltaproteobacteria bacterium]|nr:GAF domain-containing protein [Deltaproteobacteria bacterium]